MSLQFINTKKLWQTTIALVTVPTAIAITGVNSGAAAFELADLNFNNMQRLRQVLSQNGQPPEVIVGDPSSIPAPPRNADTRFNCELVNGEYTVMYYPESQPEDAYPWAIPSELGGGWTPQKRCNEITSRFESYRQDGLLELTTGLENGYDTICVTTQLDPTDCRIVLTVPPGQDPQLTRDLIFDNLLVADDGGATQGVYTFSDSQGERDLLGEIGGIINGNNSSGGSNPGGNQASSSPQNIDLRPFLDPADGGTGSQLRNNYSAPSSSERKPALFK